MSGRNSGFSRGDKIRKAMMREVSDIIARELKEPVLANQIISVTDVDISPDNRHARVYVSILGDETKRNEIMEALVESQPKIRQHVGQRIRLRYTPEIEIRYDDSLERGSRVTELLNQISKGEV